MNNDEARAELVTRAVRLPQRTMAAVPLAEQRYKWQMILDLPSTWDLNEQRRSSPCLRRPLNHHQRGTGYLADG